jgi:hypothetical protein
MRWRNPWAQEWDYQLDERVPGNEDAGTGRGQDIKPDLILRARRARESKRLRRMRRWRYG